MAETKDGRDKRIQTYVTEIALMRLTAIAQDRSLIDGHTSVSELVSQIIDDWFAAHPDEVEQADRRIRALKKQRP